MVGIADSLDHLMSAASSSRLQEGTKRAGAFVGASAGSDALRAVLELVGGWSWLFSLPTCCASFDTSLHATSFTKLQQKTGAASRGA